MGCVAEWGEPAEAVRSQCEASSDHAEAAGAGAACEGALLIGTTLETPRPFEDHSLLRESHAPDATPPHVAG